MSSIHQYWQELVGAAMLGTDRRNPPTVAAGALAEFDLEHPQPTGSQRLLQQVAACVAVQRAGVLPSPPVSPMAPPAGDPRPPTPAVVSGTWRTIVGEWALLEDEWLIAVINRGWRCAPDLVPRLLARHRGDAIRHARVVLASGPLAEWLIEWSPGLACARSGPRSPVAEVLTTLPELPITPEFASLMQHPEAVAPRLAEGLSAGGLGAAHAPLLKNVVARVDVTYLPNIAAALDRVNPASSSIGLAFALADLARLRHRMLTELEPT